FEVAFRQFNDAKKTFSGGSQATFNLGWNSERQDLAARLAGNGWPGAPPCSRLSAKPPPLASNCQRRCVSAPTWRMLQDCQRAMGKFLIYDFRLMICTRRIEEIVNRKS